MVFLWTWLNVLTKLTPSWQYPFDLALINIAAVAQAVTFTVITRLTLTLGGVDCG